MMRLLVEDAEGAWNASALRSLVRLRRMLALASRRPGGRFRSKLRDGGLTDERPALHAAVVLCRRERVRAGDFGERHAVVEAGGLGASDGKRIETHPRADTSRARAAVAERERHHTVRHAWKDGDRKLERAPR